MTLKSVHEICDAAERTYVRPSIEFLANVGLTHTAPTILCLFEVAGNEVQ